MQKIEEEAPVLSIPILPVLQASKGKLQDIENTPVEYPELKEISTKISEFLSPAQFIASEGNPDSVQEFLLSEVIEFDAKHTLEYYLFKWVRTEY
jgi:hypothetical protein